MKVLPSFPHSAPAFDNGMFDGQVYLLVDGEDFPEDGAKTIRNAYQNQAKSLGLYARTRLVGTDVVVQASTIPVRVTRKASPPAAAATEPAQGPSAPHAQDQNLLDPDLNESF